MLFIGIVMQFYAGSKVADVPLFNLCMTYSGSGDSMGVDDFNNFFDWVEANTPGCANTTKRSCLTYASAAGYFLNMDEKAKYGGLVDRLRYASEVFYCKYAPAQVASSNNSVLCGLAGVSGPCRLWTKQPLSGKPNWYTAAATSDYKGSIATVSCMDKVRVYRSFLNALFAGTWSAGDLNSAAGRFLAGCLADKGGDTYVLVIGPVVALFGAIFTVLTFFRHFAGPPIPDLGMNLLSLSIVLLLVGFWSITEVTTKHIAGRYQYCSGADAPLTAQGRWYDQSPCADKDTSGADGWNPFVVRTLWVQTIYIAGGVLTFLAVVTFLGLSGMAEAFSSRRFEKYLGALQDIPMRVHMLPFANGRGR
mmetsp:Transcript_52568/g.137904  ORF Transcript_52568/g.137904 Transcript_52568/m.137904 type:complete len:363 (+) Transcript_52568:224-1312(+)